MKFTLIGLGIVILIGVGGLFVWAKQHSQSPAVQPSDSPSPTPSPTITVSPTESPSPSVDPFASITPSDSPQPTSTPTPVTSGVFYPITNYVSRMTNRWYGKKITAADSKGLPCGAPFTGYHDGDDLETTPAEAAIDVPVYAIADGTVREAQHVNGYGGLIVIQHKLGNQTVTAYYGHISLAKTTMKASQTVKAGQQISVLGQGCSAETDNERKHLHFALHKGTAIDVRGYAPTLAELTAWINPKDTLAYLHAQEP